MIGNAVPPELARFVGEALRDYLEEWRSSLCLKAGLSTPQGLYESGKQVVDRNKEKW